MVNRTLLHSMLLSCCVKDLGRAPSHARLNAHLISIASLLSFLEHLRRRLGHLLVVPELGY